MISLKNAAQISKMRDAGKILYEVEQEVRQAIRPGVTTAELDILAERLIRKHSFPTRRSSDLSFPPPCTTKDIPAASAPVSTTKWCTASPATGEC